MSKQLFDSPWGFKDENGLAYLSGSGLAGGDASFQDSAAVGSKYIDIAAVPPLTYVKTLAGAGQNRWTLEISKSTSTTTSLNQSNHNFVVGDWVYKNQTSGLYTKSLALDADTSEVLGLVSAVPDIDTFNIVTSGFTEVATVLPNGAPLFLHPTVAGQATNIKPSTNVQKNLGFVLDGFLFVAIGISIELTSGADNTVPLIVTNNVTTIQNVDSIATESNNSVLWAFSATSATDRYNSLVHATHDGVSNDATEVSWSEFGIVSTGGQILGLDIGVTLQGVGSGQTLNLTTKASETVQITARQLKL